MFDKSKSYLRFLYWIMCSKLISGLYEPLQYLLELLEEKTLKFLDEKRERYRANAKKAKDGV